jgi:hypothetical protein
MSNDNRIRFDIFIAHAGADREPAEILYDLLAPKCRVFLDSRCLSLGDDWDSAIASAQKSSNVTLVLISSQTEKAYYLREEIAASIALARSDSERHRVVPIYLDDSADASVEVPYGLRLKQGLRISDTGRLSDVAKRLLDLLHDLQQRSTNGIEASPAGGFTGDGQAAGVATARQTELLFDVTIDVPQEMVGTEVSYILLKFDVKTAGAQARLRIEQDGFLVRSGNPDEEKEFLFRFPQPGRFEQKLELRAKEDKSANYNIVVTCYSQAERVTHQAFQVRLTKTPDWWQSLRGWYAMVRTGLRNPRLLLALLGVGIVAGIYFKYPRTERDRWELALRMDLNKPVDFAKFAPVQSELTGETFVDDDPVLSYEQRVELVHQRWLWRNAQVKFYKPGASVGQEDATHIEISGPQGYAFLKAGLIGGAFYDFIVQFNVSLVKGNKVDWLLRVFPPPPKSGTGWRPRFYRFQYRVESRSVYLDSYRCSSLDQRSCQLWAKAQKALWESGCGDPQRFSVWVKALQNTITVHTKMFVRNPGGSECAVVNPLPRSTFTDSDWLPRYQYGGIGFLATDQAQTIGIEPLAVYTQDAKSIEFKDNE